MIAAVVHFFKTPDLMIGSASFWWGVLIVVVAFLMISTVRYSSFKEFDVKKAKPSLALARDSNADRTDLSSIRKRCFWRWRRSTSVPDR